MTCVTRSAACPCDIASSSAPPAIRRLPHRRQSGVFDSGARATRVVRQTASADRPATICRPAPYLIYERLVPNESRCPTGRDASVGRKSSPAHLRKFSGNQGRDSRNRPGRRSCAGRSVSIRSGMGRFCTRGRDSGSGRSVRPVHRRRRSLIIAARTAFQTLQHRPADFVGEVFVELVVPDQKAHVDRAVERVEDEVEVAAGG